MKKFKLLLGISFAILFLWLILRQTNIKEIEKAFNGTSWKWIIATLAAFFVGYACRIERWGQMMERDNPGLQWSDCAGPLWQVLQPIMFCHSGPVMSFAHLHSIESWVRPRVSLSQLCLWSAFLICSFY